MARLKTIIIVLLLVAGGGGGVLYGVTKFYQAKVLADAESRTTGAAAVAVDGLRLQAFERLQSLSHESRGSALLVPLGKAPATANLSEEAIATTLTPARDELFPMLDGLQKKSHFNRLLIVSPDGRVLARTPEKDKFGDSVKALPAVAECLGSLYRDGLYELDSKLTQVAAAPVLDDKGKVAGCLVSEDEIATETLQGLAKKTGLEVAVFLRKAVAVSTLEAPVVQPMAEQLESEMIWFGQPRGSLPMMVNLDGHAFLARTSAIPGGTDPLRLAVILPVPDLFAPLHDMQKNVFFGMGAALVLGLLLTFLVPGGKDRQARRLRDELQLMVNGDRNYVMEANGYSGIFRELAASISQLGGRSAPATRPESVSDLLGKSTEPAARAEPSQSVPPLDFESLLGGGPAEQGAPAPAPSPREPAPGPSPRTPAATPEFSFETPPEPPPPPPPAPAARRSAPAPGPRVDLPGELAGIFDEQEETREVAPVVPPQARLEPGRPMAGRPSSPSQPPRPAYVPSVAPVNLAAPPVLDLGEEDQITSADYRPDATVIAQVPDELLRAASTESSDPGSVSPIGPVGFPKPPVSSPPTMRGAGSSEDTHFREVFDQFLKTKRQCSESIVGLTFDKFAEKLRKNAAELKTRYSCTAVRFQVYVKNGKAALKATPSK